MEGMKSRRGACRLLHKLHGLQAANSKTSASEVRDCRPSTGIGMARVLQRLIGALPIKVYRVSVLQPNNADERWLSLHPPTRATCPGLEFQRRKAARCRSHCVDGPRSSPESPAADGHVRRQLVMGCGLPKHILAY